MTTHTYGTVNGVRRATIDQMVASINRQAQMDPDNSELAFAERTAYLKFQSGWVITEERVALEQAAEVGCVRGGSCDPSDVSSCCVPCWSERKTSDIDAIRHG